ncbi:MAG: hypothetical protein ACTSSE_13890 [Candidatus Thorarchaeota archaeon]
MYSLKNLYEIEVSGQGDPVEFVVRRLNSEISNNEFGYIEVSEGMGLDTVYERLREAVSVKLWGAEFELESPDELRESLLVILQRLVDEEDCRTWSSGERSKRAKKGGNVTTGPWSDRWTS